MAEQVGQEYGRAMAAGLSGADVAAGQRSLRSAMQAVADALTAHGFAAHADQRNNQLRIVNNHCPFGDVAIEHPVICAVDRGMVKGMLGALYGDTDVSTMHRCRRATRSARRRSEPRYLRSWAYSMTRVTISSSHLLTAPQSNGGCGSYSIIS